MATYTKKTCILIVAIFFYLTPVFAQTVDTILISSPVLEKFIGANCYHRIDSYFKQHSTSNEWTQIKTPHVWLCSDSIHWIYGAFKNTDSINKTLKLNLNNVQAGITKMYLVIDGKMDSTKMTGSLLPLGERTSWDRTLSIPFSIPAGSTGAFYLKTWRRQSAITLTLTLTDPSLNNINIWTDYLLLIVLTFIFTILVAAIIVLMYAPSRETLWFFVYILFGFFYVLDASGFGSLYLWSALPWFEENAAVFLAAISAASFFEFSRTVLKTKSNYPVINTVLIIFSITYSLTGLLGFSLYFSFIQSGLYSGMLTIGYMAMLLCLLIVAYISFYEAAVNGKKEFWWFVSIFSFYIIFSFITVLLELSYIKYNHHAHAILLAFGALPQMTLALLFLIKKVITLLKERTSEIAATKIHGHQVLLSERLRISRELHDEVGATLSGITMYSHLTKEQIKHANTTKVVKSLNIIQQSAGEMVNKLNDIVWLINPDHDSLQKLTQRLEEYAIEMAAIKNMQVKVNIPADLHEHNIPMETRRNIYLFCKEAINNVVKYSNGTVLQLNIKEIDNKLEFSVSDNGQGFDTVMVRRGNGLENMQKRADAIGAKLTLQSKQGEGSMLSMQVKITQ